MKKFLFFSAIVVVLFGLTACYSSPPPKPLDIGPLAGTTVRLTNFKIMTSSRFDDGTKGDEGFMNIAGDLIEIAKTRALEEYGITLDASELETALSEDTVKLDYDSFKLSSMTFFFYDWNSDEPADVYSEIFFGFAQIDGQMYFTLYFKETDPEDPENPYDYSIDIPIEVVEL